MNLGDRIRGALAAVSGALSAEVAANAAADAANAAADATFRENAEATFLALGTLTSETSTALAELKAQVEAGGTIDPAAFATLESKIASLDAAFPDPEVQPPAEDEVEDPIEDEGSTPTE